MGYTSRKICGKLLTSPLLKTKRLALHYREIQEVRDSLEGFRATVEAGEVTGFEAGGMRRLTSHRGASGI
jgi:hypothetical protein